jgi:hypothetical protein
VTAVSTAHEELPRQEVALNTLKDIRRVLDEASGSDWSLTEPAKMIDHLLYMTYARLRMAGRWRRIKAARWLAKLPGGCFPRSIVRAPGEDAEPYVCFVVEITDGAKVAVGRTVEVRIPAEDAPYLADCLLRNAAGTSPAETSTRARHMDPLAGLLPKEDNA